MSDEADNSAEKDTVSEGDTVSEAASGGSPQKTGKPGRKKRVRRWLFALFFKRGVLYSLILSVVIFVLYIIGSMPDPGISDQLLFLLLRLLWYSSLMLCVFSLFTLGLRVRRLVYRPSLRNALSLFFYFVTGLFGAALVIFNSFIVAASRGNL